MFRLPSSLLPVSLLRTSLAILLGGFLASSAHAATFTVTSTADSGAGTLRQAILDANATADADVITFALPSGPQTIDLTTAGDGRSALVLSRDVTIYGPEANLLTVQRSTADGTAGFTIFEVSADATASIRGLTISNGINTGYGFDPDSGSIAIGYRPGGGIVNNGTLTLADCAVSGNEAVGGYRGGFGGGIYNSDSGKLTVTNCTFSSNSATRGGAIYGGATITNCTFSSNSAGVLGSSSLGGAIFSTGSSALTNCTFSDNKTPLSGNSISFQGPLTVNNTIFNDATPTGLAGGAFTDGGYNLTRDNGGTLLTASTDKLNADPLLGALASNGGSTPTLALLKGSPAIDAGETSLSTDQRGLSRPYGKADDIGAFEWQQALRPVVTALLLTPTTPRTGETLTAIANATDSSGATVTFTYQWFRTRGGKTVKLRETGSTFATGDGAAVADDVITVTVTAQNGAYSSELKSASVTIQNSPISISGLTLIPRGPYTFDKLVANVQAVDPDKTRALYSYVWTKNGVVTQTVTNSRSSQNLYYLSTQGLGDKGDVIEVTVTASDGASSASVKASATVHNSVPVLTQLALSPDAPAPAQVIVASYAGRDGDGDALTRIYKWKIGNKVLSDEHTSRLDLSKYPQVKVGDIITLGMRLSDGESLSNALEASVTVVAADPAKTSNLQGIQPIPSAPSS